MSRAVLSLVLVASIASASIAQPPGRGRPGGDQEGRGRPGARDAGAKDKGNEGQRAEGRRPGDMAGRRGPATGNPMMEADPAKVAAKMMETFDKNDDGKLSSSELIALVKSMRERIGRSQGGPRGPGARGGEKADKPTQARGEGRGDMRNRRGGNRGGDRDGAEAGGDKPKRPRGDRDA